MIIKKCDRCGNIVKNDEDAFASTLERIAKKVGKKQSIAEKVVETIEINSCVDFCSDCVKSFKKWWEEGTDNEQSQ